MMDTDIQQFLRDVPSAQSRVLIDMVNSLDVARDHIRGASTTHSITARFLGAVTGSMQRRNAHIAQSHHLALDGAIACITELAQRQSQSNFAIAQVADRLSYVENSLALAAGLLAETRETVQQLRVTIDAQVYRLDQEVGRLDLRTAASEQLDNVVSRWEAGRFDRFPKSSRCYIAAHELLWGAFGDYLRTHPGAANIPTLIETFQNRAAAHLRRSAGGEDALSLTAWLSGDRHAEADAPMHRIGLAYLGTNADARTQPWSYTLSQLPSLDQAPSAVSRYCGADVVAQRVAREFFAPSREAANV